MQNKEDSMHQKFMMMALKDAIAPQIRWHGVPKTCKHTVEKVDFNPENGCLMARVKVSMMRLTRKRFIRVLMALGFKARDAHMIANEAMKRDLPYSLALEVLLRAGNEEEPKEEPEESR
jgi:hypothetical protein